MLRWCAYEDSAGGSGPSEGLRVAAAMRYTNDGCQHPPELSQRSLQNGERDSRLLCVKTSRGEKLAQEVGQAHLLPWMGDSEESSIVNSAMRRGDFSVAERNCRRATILGGRKEVLKGLYAWVGFRTEMIPLHRPRREWRHRKYGWIGFSNSLTGCHRFHNRPLRIVSILGLYLGVVIPVRIDLLLEHFLSGSNQVAWLGPACCGMTFLWACSSWRRWASSRNILPVV